MAPGDVELWDPQVPATLRGVFVFHDRSHCAVRSEDGIVWLLVTDAEEQLRALVPDEGQDVQIMCIRSADSRRFYVSIH
jgi:hypothetical protein